MDGSGEGIVSNTNSHEGENSHNMNKKMEYAFNSLVGAAIAAVLLLCAVLYLYFENFSGVYSTLNADWGTFGDYLGGTLNPIFSLLAFMALLYTIRLQSYELKNSTEQLRKSANALALQNKNIEKQNFESTFFNLIDNYRRQTERLRFTVVRNAKKTTWDYNQIHVHVKELVSDVSLRLDDVDSLAIQTRLDFQKLINPVVGDFFNGDANYLIRLCEGIILILMFIDKASLPDEDKCFYVKVLEKQISIAEIVALYFNTMGSEEAFNIFKKYRFFNDFVLSEKRPCKLTDIKDMIYAGEF